MAQLLLLGVPSRHFQVVRADTEVEIVDLEEEGEGWGEEGGGEKEGEEERG